MSFNDFYKGKTVLVTGHTGFKGAWLCEWLLNLGANVVGFSLKPHTHSALFDQLQLETRVEHHIGDICDTSTFQQLIKRAQPDVCFHLAAQSLVRESYKNPIETYRVNLMGTVNVLQSLEGIQKPCAAVFITTDKCYDNKEWHYGYREEDPIGGHDPYSASKGCAEIAIQSYRRSFYSIFKGSHIGVASARAGNVLGGGDWAEDRLMTSCVQALVKGEPIGVRSPRSTRPWQHVLEPLSGYLLLGQRIAEILGLGIDKEELNALCSSFNFGPLLASNRTVRECVELVIEHWEGSWFHLQEKEPPHEAERLHLSIDKAHHLLSWYPVWDFTRTISETIRWYRNVECSTSKQNALLLTVSQIEAYTKDAKEDGLAWAR
jgi:CDP-glucose 4,6-dehydratase